MKANIPSSYDSKTENKVYIIDTLPDNLGLTTYKETSLFGVEVADNNSFKNSVGFGDDCSSVVFEIVKDNKITIDKTVEDNKITISFDASKVAGQTVYFRIHAKIAGKLFQGSESQSHEFENTVIMSQDGTKEIDRASQKQTITNTIQALSKEGALATDALNTVEYTIDINENAVDLLKEGNTLTLTDTLITSADKEVIANLKEGSVEVYEIDENGNQTELTTKDYSVSSIGYSTSANNKYYYYATLQFQIPDEKHLKIKYKYSFEGEKGVWLNADNKAVLEGIVISNNESSKNMVVEIQKSGAQAYIKGINLYKVDNENNALVLEGAKFELYYWDKETNDWKQNVSAYEDGLYTTDGNGFVALSDLTYNLAYKLVEKVAPSGYALKTEPYYFCIESADTVKYEKSAPSNFYTDLHGENVTPGQSVYFTNDKNTTSIEIAKLWKNADNTMPGEIYVNIGRRLGSEVTEQSENYYTIHVDKRDPNGYIKMYKGFASVKAGSKFTYSFYASNGSKPSLPVVTENGQKIDYSGQVSGEYQLVTRTLEVNSDITISIADTGWDFDDISKYPVTGSIELPDTSTAEGLADDLENRKYMENVPIKEADDWELTIDGLERYYVDETTGKKYVWNYFVSEASNVYYTATYSDNNDTGITSGTITITNTRNDVETFILPQTGGVGKVPYTIGGIVLVTFALLGEEIYRRKRKKENE